MTAIKTHAIVSPECGLRAHHVGLPVTFNGVTGLLIRYIPSCEHALLELTNIEVAELLTREDGAASA